MKKNCLIICFVSIFLFSNSYAFDFKNIYKVKTFSAANLEINETNLIDDAHALNIVKDFKALYLVLAEQNNELKKKNNKNRKKIKTKGLPEEIYEDYADSVVYIINKSKKSKGYTGSGFFIKHKGKQKIITNWHVIEDAKELEIYLKKKEMAGNDYDIRKEDAYKAKLIKFNKKKDLAMLEVANLSLKIKPLKYGKFNRVKIGETLFAIGHPKGLLWSFTNGMVSHIRKDYRWHYEGSHHKANVIQIQVPINPGNSGGPLFNKNKELVGVNTFTTEGENLNFAVGIDDVIEFLNEKPKKIIKSSTDNKWIKKKKRGPTWIKKKKKKSFKTVSPIEGDYDDNGIVDCWYFDDNKNGIYEKIYADRDEDGNIDMAIYDTNEDKIVELVLYDDDGNGSPEKALIDEDEDGKMDVTAYDYDEDGKWDKYEKA